MNLYRLDDPGIARAQAEVLISDLRGCRVPELAQLGRTLHAWQVELCAHVKHPAMSTSERWVPLPDAQDHGSANAHSRHIVL
jgi:hypothetical protein